jgi:D-galactarolactone isomerase
MYREVMQRLNVERVVLVQPTAYGRDNACLLDALNDLQDAARGVFLVTPDTPRETLNAWTAAGCRGARFFMLPGAILSWDMLEPVARKVSELGWHIQLQLDGRMLADHEQSILRLPCPVVIDHNGKFLEPVGPDHPGMKSLLRLLDSGKVWVKTSAPYETSRTGAPDYSDVGVIAKRLIDTARRSKAKARRCQPVGHPLEMGAVKRRSAQDPGRKSGAALFLRFPAGSIDLSETPC